MPCHDFMMLMNNTLNKMGKNVRQNSKQICANLDSWMLWNAQRIQKNKSSNRIQK